MKRPIIGLTPQYDREKNRIWMRHQYTDAISLAGGLPLLLVQYEDPEEISAAADTLDGVLFTGGVDIHPKYYGENVLPECGEISETRDMFELALYKQAVLSNMPVFGICRGIQLINVGCGGTLHQHIEGHSGVFHKIAIQRGGMLHDIIGSDSITVNSYHHQAVKVNGPGFNIDAYSEDDAIIEAVSSPSASFHLAVQWHPENTYHDDEYSKRLFSAFVTACGAYRLRK